MLEKSKPVVSLVPNIAMVRNRPRIARWSTVWLLVGWVGLGSVQAQEEGAPPPMTLTLHQAMGWAVAHHAEMQRVEEQAKEAAAHAREARAALLPSVGLNSYQIRQTENLRAMGLALPGLPVVNGPFDTFDARVEFSQQLFDLMHRNLSQSAATGIEVARFDRLAKAQQIAGAAGLAYLAVQQTVEAVQAAQANETLTQALLQLAIDQEKAGLATGVDRVRAEAALAQSAFQLEQAKSQEAEAMTRLHRALGMDLNIALVLSEPMAETVPDHGPDDEDRALEQRPELRALEKTVEQRKSERKAAEAASYPTVGLVGAIGPSGVLPSQYDYRTYSYGIQMALPLYQGGALTARVDQADSRLRQAQWTLQDGRRQVAEDVRLARLALKTQQAQLRAASDRLLLSQRLLDQSRDRFASGVADNLELMDAQAQLAAAQSDRIGALGALNMARINYELATGQLDVDLPTTPESQP